MTHSAICIAGAHRSGTSMIARLLHQCGLDLGPEHDLMPAAQDNPDGFWENLRFVQLNDEILNALGAAWDLPPSKSQTFTSEALQPVRMKAQLLIEEFAGRSSWGWKDPRNCLTLPFWQGLLPNLRTIFVVRHPLEVAYSMHKRNGLSYALGLRLWEIYNRRLLAHTDAQSCVVTSYTTFFSDPEAELRRIATFAGLPNDNRIAQAAALVASNRRHTTFTIDQMIDAGVAEPIITLYQTLREAASGTASSGLRSLPSSPRPDNRLQGAESQLRTSIPDGEDVRRELAQRRGAEIQTREELARHQQTIDGLRQELAAKSVQAAAEINRRDGRIEELQKAYAKLDQILEEEQRQRTELDRARGELAHVRERFTQTNELLQKLSVRLSDSESRSTSLTDRLRKHLLEMKRLVRLLDQIDEAATRLRNSRRWKLANPFAALRAALTGKPVPGFGHLDKNVGKYRTWCEHHPEAASLDEEIQSLRAGYLRPPPEGLAPKEKPPAAPFPIAKPPPPIEPVMFVRPDEPEISIIIPAYNQVDFTLACLGAVAQHSGNIPYEVIVVDDASTDATPALIGKIPGLIYLRSETNAGFIAACNRGAAAAHGRYLVFLNNDTTVNPGWLDALRDTFHFEPTAGLVGSKLIYPDGRLQEAGGIIWRDGSGWNRGKFQDPAKPEYNYLREVDYCSAASVMIPKSLFDELGGFDRKYAPAYYEDTDLAFKVAQSNKKVLYQPLSTVTHYEGVTSGTDLSAGAKKFQEINRKTFVEAWPAALAKRPANGDLASFEALQPGSKRILVIDHHLPMPDRDSGSLRMYQILTILCGLRHRVTFLPDNLADIPPYTGELAKRGVEVMHHPYVKSVRAYLEAHGSEFDVVILSRCDFARKHIADVRDLAPQSRIIFDTVDLHFLRQDREAALADDSEKKDKALIQRQLEFELVEQADQTWVVSPVEQSLLRAAFPRASIEIVSNIVDVPGSATPFSMRSDVLFIGSFKHPPNIDAVMFFTRDIFPLVRSWLPGLKFHIIGEEAPPEVMALADEDIIVMGYQPDVNCYFNRIKLSVAPLRYGAGVKGKINQSMGFGVPVVATSVAVEGMSLTAEKDVMIGDDPQSFAAAVVTLYGSEELWSRLSADGLAKTRETFSREAARRQLACVISNHERDFDQLQQAQQAITASPDVAESPQVAMTR